MTPSQDCIDRCNELVAIYQSLVKERETNLGRIAQLEEKLRLTEKKVALYEQKLAKANEQARVAEARAIAAEQTLMAARNSEDAQGGREQEEVATLKLDPK